MIISLLAPAVFALCQEPVGGWYQGIWSVDSEPNGTLFVQALPDITGDGYPDQLVQHGVRCELVDGTTGLARLAFTTGTQAVIPYSIDLDGDGQLDLLLAEPRHTSSGLFERGRVAAFSGGTLAPLWQHEGLHANDRFGYELQFADTDFDNDLDVIAIRKDRPNTRIQVLDGASGAPQWNASGLDYNFLELTDDLDGDRVPDFLLGRESQLELISGATGSPLWIASYLNQDVAWDSVSIADQNADGWMDLVLGVPGFNPIGDGNRGAILAYDGRTGTVLWDVRAKARRYESFADEIRLADVTGDGTSDVLSSGIQQAVLFDGRTGAMIWSRNTAQGNGASEIFHTRLNADAIPDILTWRKQDGAMLEAIDGATGDVLWRYIATSPLHVFAELEIGDLDFDGLDDILMSTPLLGEGLDRRGSLYAFSGSDGNLLWSRDGAQTDSRLGLRIALANLDSVGGLDVYYLADGSDGPKADTGYHAVNGGTGQVIHSVLRRALEPSTETWRTHDFDGDGLEELIASSTVIGNRESHQLVINGSQGSVVWAAAPEHTGNSSDPLAFLPDRNNDGYAELLRTRTLANGVSIVELISGKDGGHRPGLSADPSSLSVAAGGDIRLELDFPTRYAGCRFQLLSSRTGVGPSNYLGLRIPLTQDALFRANLAGQYFGIVNRRRGQLNVNGDALASIHALPGEVPASVIGQRVWLAAVLAWSASQPTLSSAAVEVQWIP